MAYHLFFPNGLRYTAVISCKMVRLAIFSWLDFDKLAVDQFWSYGAMCGVRAYMWAISIVGVLTFHTSYANQLLDAALLLCFIFETHSAQRLVWTSGVPPLSTFGGNVIKTAVLVLLCVIYRLFLSSVSESKCGDYLVLVLLSVLILVFGALLVPVSRGPVNPITGKSAVANVPETHYRPLFAFGLT